MVILQHQNIFVGIKDDWWENRWEWENIGEGGGNE